METAIGRSETGNTGDRPRAEDFCMASLQFHPGTAYSVDT